MYSVLHLPQFSKPLWGLSMESCTFIYFKSKGSDKFSENTQETKWVAPRASTEARACWIANSGHSINICQTGFYLGVLLWRSRLWCQVHNVSKCKTEILHFADETSNCNSNAAKYHLMCISFYGKHNNYPTGVQFLIPEPVNILLYMVEETLQVWLWLRIMRKGS